MILSVNSIIPHSYTEVVTKNFIRELTNDEKKIKSSVYGVLGYLPNIEMNYDDVQKKFFMNMEIEFSNENYVDFKKCVDSLINELKYMNGALTTVTIQ